MLGEASVSVSGVAAGGDAGSSLCLGFFGVVLCSRFDVIPAILSPNLPHQLFGFLKISFGVNLGHERFAMSEHHLRRVEAELTAQLGRAGMPQLIRTPPFNFRFAARALDSSSITVRVVAFARRLLRFLAPVCSRTIPIF